MAALSSEPQARLSVPAALSWGQCPDLTSTQGQRAGHTTKMDFLQEPRPPGTPGQGVRPLQRLSHCPQSARVFPAEEGRRQEPSVTACHLKVSPAVLFGSFSIWSEAWKLGLCQFMWLHSSSLPFMLTPVT